MKKYSYGKSYFDKTLLRLRIHLFHTHMVSQDGARHCVTRHRQECSCDPRGNTSFKDVEKIFHSGETYGCCYSVDYPIHDLIEVRRPIRYPYA